jgi:hypothetical protein
MAKRYSLPDGQSYRPFGIGEVYTNDNIDDEKVERLLKANPDARKVFIDAEAKPAEDPKPSDLDALTKKELHAKYAELTGKSADEKLNKAELVELVQYEIDAAALLG